MTEPSIEHVSDTAYLVAYARSLEGTRREPLFVDPLAAHVAGEKGKAIFDAFTTARMMTWTVALRTVIIDDFIRDAVSRGVRNVLSLGAGLDTRPYRVELPADLVWTEVDYPDVVAFKEKRLEGEAPHCKLERIGLDLADDDGRHALLDRVARQGPVLILTEGVVPYLDNAEVATLAGDLAALPNVDGWILDYTTQTLRQYRERTGQAKRMQAAPFKFQPGDWFAFFAEHGWRAREVRYYNDEASRLHRPAPLPWKMRLIIKATWPFVPKARREAMRKLAGYALLEPAAR